ncbi:MAG: hemerythrin domain-containing protein [Anaerolineales bacterium]|jgi:hemerythrin-like domain-containing protein
MSIKQETNIAVSFYNIHSIITRGLRVSLESAQGILQRGFQGEMTREGFFNYVRSLTSVMNAHHLTEDDIAFPYFRDKLPEAPFDDWTYWHGKMAEMLDEINLALKKYEKKGELETELRNIENALARLNEGWPFHIQPETDEFINKADALVPVEEQLRLVSLFAEYVLENALPLYLTVPFMLYNLPVEDRKAFSQWIPAEGILNLVPVVWKEKWASMAPYLLT